MTEHSPRRRPSVGVIVVLVAIALSAGSATAWLTWRAIAPRAPEANFPEVDVGGETLPEGIEGTDGESVTVPDPPESEVATDPSQQQGQVYWIAPQGQTLALMPVRVDLSAAESPDEALKLAFDNLMSGPTPASGEAATTIPEQTDLLGLTVEADGIHVNLSDEFTQGGGSVAMIGRLAQVVYTATSLDPEAAVWLSVDGEPLTVLGGEGLLIRQPITRSDLKTDFGIAAATSP